MSPVAPVAPVSPFILWNSNRKLLAVASPLVVTSTSGTPTLESTVALTDPNPAAVPVAPVGPVSPVGP